jgi:hypothetical protein
MVNSVYQQYIRGDLIVTTIRWSSVSSLLGALAVIIGTLFHPPLTNPWETDFAFHEMAHHHHWVLDHSIFFLGILFWLFGLSYLGDLYSSSKPHPSSGGRNAARCFVGAVVMWMMILTVEIAVFPPFASLIIDNQDQIAREIWNALFTWGLFAGYLAMGLVYIGIIFLSLSCDGLSSVLSKVAGIIGILGVIWSLLLPNAALVIQLITAPFPFIWTIWFSLRLIKN